jgi:hypothetical protein
MQCPANLNPTGRPFASCLHITDQEGLVAFTQQPYRSILYPLDAPQVGFNFAEFDSKTAQLDLIVTTSKVLKFVFPDAENPIPGTVQTPPLPADEGLLAQIDLAPAAL